MPQPALDNVEDRLYLQNVANISRNENFELATKIPRVTVGSDSKILTYPRGPWFRDDVQLRAPGTKAYRGGYATTSTNVTPLPYAHGKAVTDEDVRVLSQTGQAPINPAVRAIDYCANQLNLKIERLIADGITAATWATTTEDAAGLWIPAGTTNTFITDILAGKETIRSGCGRYPNTLILDSKTFEYQLINDELEDKYKHTMGPQSANLKQIIAAVLGLDNVFVVSASRSSAEEVLAGTDFTAAALFEVNSAKGTGWLGYLDMNPSTESEQAFVCVNKPFDNGQIRLVRSYREEAEMQTVYEVHETFDWVQVNANAAMMWSDTHTT